MKFYVAWIIVSIILLICAGSFGKVARGNVFGLLIDGRGRFSLNNLQLTMWTLLILSTVVIVFFWYDFDPTKLKIPSDLLVLLGISVGSGAASVVVKTAKDVSGAQVASGGKMGGKSISPSIGQVLKEEEGGQMDAVVDITKFQNLMITLVVGLVYVILTARAEDFPMLPEQVVWLIGISHAGYIAGKLPDRAKK